MKQELVVPRMGESITEATIGTVFKTSGSSVNADEEILELETDKVNQVVYAPASGVVQLHVNPQDKVKIEQVIGFIETSEPKKETMPAEKKVESPTKPPQAPKTTSPGTLRKTREEFVSEIKAPTKTSTPSSIEVGQAKERETRKKLPKIRQVIAERLVAAQHTAAMLTTFNEVDLTQIIILRERYKEHFLKEYDVKLGFMSFFVKAAVSALRSFPEVNAYLDGEDLVYRNYYDIGIAVSTERGLVVPVLKDCDELTFAEIEQSIDAFATKAKQGSLSVDDLKGGGFTITNGGVFGSLLSTPILNPPQTAILGMHKILKRPVAIQDQVMIRPMMYLALTYDHRVIDGREAVSFLVHIKECLEDPARLLLHI